MTIANDWNVDYSGKVISHIDGVLSYDTGDGTWPSVGEMIIGAVSGAVGKILARTGDASAGTFTLTNVVGLFDDDENIYVLSELDFDAVTLNNGGFKVGDTIAGNSSGSTIVVKFIEYNIDGTAGHGTIYGRPMSALFTNNEQLDISGGQTDVADADGTGTDNDVKITTTLANGTLAVPGTADTNDCEIVHYDAGTIPIPEDAHIQSVTSTAEGYAQRVFGNTVTGSIRVIDSDTTGGSWTDDETLRMLDCVYYDNLVSGLVFSVGNVLKGLTSGAVGRVLAVIDDGDDTGKLILAGFSGTWTDSEKIQVKQDDDTYLTTADVEDTTNKYLDAAVLNLPNGSRKEQREDQGGIFAGTDSLNLVRSSNAFYTYLMDLFDELSALDDDEPVDGNVKDQLYTILNDYVIPDLSFRFLEKGSWKDSGNNNVFTAIQTTGVIADVGDHGFLYDSSNPTPQPDMYVEQDGGLVRQDWLEGQLDVLLKNKTSTDPAYINPNVESLGQLINGGAFTVHVRPYRRTYDSNEVAQVGGIAVVALGNAPDANNTTGQYDFTFTSGGAGAFTVGEEITTPSGKRGIITLSDSGTDGDIEYVLKSGTQFAAADVITGSVSAKSATLSGTVGNLVAGYGTNVKTMTVDSRFTGGTTTVASFIIGETVNQAGGGAYVGYVMEDDGGDIYTQDVSGTRASAQQLTGATSGALNTPTGNEDYATCPKDIGSGVGDKNYTAVTSGDITGASAQLLSAVYEWWKFLTRKESVLLQGGPSTAAGVEGRFFRKLVDTFREIRGASPYGSKAGDLVIGSVGHFIDKDTLDSSDLRNIKLFDNLDDEYDPPNLQVLAISNIVAGVRAAAYRTAAQGTGIIQRTEFDVGAVGGDYNGQEDSKILFAAGDRSVSPLPADVPDTGVVLVLDPNGTGNYLSFIYDTIDRDNNWVGLKQGIGQNTIGDVTGSQDLVATDNLHVAFIQEEATGTSVTNTIQYVADIYLLAVARIKGKKPYKTAAATFGSGGVDIGANLLSDDVVNLP
jgi:hypothetical protein